MRVTWIVLAVLVAVGCAALGGSSDAATDEEIALAGVIRLSDFPPGWRDEGEATFISTEESYEDLDERFIEETGGCPTLDMDPTKSATAFGHRIVRNDVTIVSIAIVYPADIESVMAAFADERTVECEREAAVEGRSHWVPRPVIEAGMLSSSITGADQVVVIQVEITGSSGGRWVWEERRVQVGPAVISVFTSRGWDADHDSTVSDEVTQKAVDRVRESLGR